MLLQQGFEPRSNLNDRGLRAVSDAFRGGVSPVSVHYSPNGPHESHGIGMAKKTRAQMLLPSPENMPPVRDVKPGRKPPYSHRQLAAMAILRAPARSLFTSEICDWISQHFQFYRDDDTEQAVAQSRLAHGIRANIRTWPGFIVVAAWGYQNRWSLAPTSALEYYHEESNPTSGSP